jgi:hypothetical protein
MARADRVGRMAAALAAAILMAWSAPAFAASVFSDWAAVVVAGDWHASGGVPSEAFDNARRDVAHALESAGFQKQNVRQFSVRPERYRDAAPGKSDPREIYRALGELTARTSGGCLIYFTSHGAPQGVVVDQNILPPAILGAMVDKTCGARPTVVVISACYSGVFIPDLARSNRMVLTAARPDRTSFGCGQDNKYPYFDDCFLQSMKGAGDFTGLAQTARTCVAVREAQTGMRPPSEPQVWIGPELRPMLPLYGFSSASPADAR